MPRWDNLQKKYNQEDVSLLCIYSRERHPQEPGYPDYHHTTTDEERMTYAKDWASRCELSVAVDGIDERALKKYGRVPNAAFVVDRNGILVFKSQWADHAKIEIVVDTLLEYEKAKDVIKGLLVGCFFEIGRLLELEGNPAQSG